MSQSNTDLADISSRILYEDNHLLIVNKRAGEIVQGDKTGDEPLLERVRQYIKVSANKPGNVFCGLVHRIDRPVSGAVIFAKTSKALARMNALVKDRAMQKTYWAIVEQAPEEPEGTLVHYLRKNERTNTSEVSKVEREGWQRAELFYHLLASGDRYHLLEVDLHTGRHHQIRAQLSAIGCPIKGDLKYGAKRSNEDGSISLHARRVRFEHPVRHEMIEVVAPPFNQLFVKLLQNLS
ncbi:MAG: RNA pseudouridine synthase [Bacteroidales bacterium]|nr:RNA pseudouridine synthase [Bacteroidales bacterium]